MDNENAFLRAILDKPGDDVTRLVYADWLEERGDPQSLACSEFLRLEVQLAKLIEEGMTETEPRRARLVTRLQVLRNALDFGWLMAFRKLPVRIRVQDGIFSGMEGTIERWDAERQAVWVSLIIFGRPVTIQLEFFQVELIS